MPSDSREPEPEPIVVSAALREKPLAPRLITLRFGEDLDVPDLPEDTELLFGPAWSERAVPDPGLGVRNIVGAPPPPSAGRGTGLGGGEGAGAGSGDGHGVGEGPFDPGTLERLPELVYRPDDPPYPKRAIEAGVRGEVILRIQVNPDGTTTVLSTLRTVPHCVALAWRLAEQYRWKPGVKDGRAVTTTGIIIVHFELESIRR